MGLDAGRMERRGPFTDGLVRVLSEKEIYLLEGSAVGLDTIEASHVDDCRSYFLKLGNGRYIFARRLPHVPVDQGELYLVFHIGVI